MEDFNLLFQGIIAVCTLFGTVFGGVFVAINLFLSPVKKDISNIKKNLDNHITEIKNEQKELKAGQDKLEKELKAGQDKLEKKLDQLLAKK